MNGVYDDFRNKKIVSGNLFKSFPVSMILTEKTIENLFKYVS